MAAALLFITLLAPVSALQQYPPWRGHEVKAASMIHVETTHAKNPMAMSMLQMESENKKEDIAEERQIDQELDLVANEAMGKAAAQNMEMQRKLAETMATNKAHAGFLEKEAAVRAILHPKPPAAFIQKQRDYTEDTNPMIIVGAIGIVAILLIVAVIASKNRGEGYKAFGDKSGLSTSSSDITSSETGSTDRELKSRMERFEKRLEDHKKMLETKGDGESSSVSGSEVTGSSRR